MECPAEPISRLVVGVTPHQPPDVVRCAARFATPLDAELICAYVDPGRYVVAEHPDGTVDSRPLDPDQPDWDSAAFDPALAERIRTAVAGSGVNVEFRALAGDIAHALGRLAELLDAQLIVVGSRRGGLRTSWHEFIGGSVAAHLVHRQPRPVLVVPLTPVPAGGRLPWEGRP